MYFTINLLQKKEDKVDFSTAFTIVIAPAIVLFIANLCIGLMGLPEFIGLIALVLALILVFFMSKNYFDWGAGKAATLCGVYLASQIGTTVLLTGGIT
jgi:hypothetical protein